MKNQKKKNKVFHLRERVKGERKQVWVFFFWVCGVHCEAWLSYCTALYDLFEHGYFFEFIVC